MNNRAYQICQRCVMDTTDEDIVFDEMGYCNHCTTFLADQESIAYKKGESEEILKVIIENIKEKGKNKKYDSLMGISGGVDSSYAVHLAVEMGLRPLLIHMDNGWDTEIAVQNIKNVVDKLNLDYVSYVIDWKEFREIQLAFLKASTVDLEYPTDIGILASLYEVAAKHGIKYIISGSNNSGEGILPLTWGYHPTHDFKYYKSIVDKYSTVKLKKVPHVSWLGEVYYKFGLNIRTVYFLNYIDYDKDKAREFLKENYGWKEYGGKHHESKITAFWQGYVMPTKFNMDYRRATASCQICSGQITRDEALEKLKSLPYDPETIPVIKNFIAKKYAITNEELDQYLSLPPKTYKDFPNSRQFMAFIFKTYKSLFKKKRL